MATTETATAPPQLPHHKVKIKKPGQRACNEKDAKGKFCGGHLKRWFYTTDVLEQACGDAEEGLGNGRRGLSLRALQDALLAEPRGVRGLNVAGPGQTSIFGLTCRRRSKSARAAPSQASRDHHL